VLAAGVRLDDEVPVVHLRGPRGGLDRREAGVADRRRRQPGADARVVGRVALELGVGQRLGPVVRLVPAGGVDAERDAVGEPVVDDGRDDRTLAGHPRLALDHRGDDENVVGREVLASGAADVDAREVVAEGRELARDERSRGGARAHLVRRREEEALQRARAARGAVAKRVQRAGEALGGREVATPQPRLADDRDDLAA